VSQPFDRGATLCAPGEIDKSTGEFWSENPWSIAGRHNLSFYERNRTFLNVRGKDFLEISHLTGADTNGDSRCVVAADLNHDGLLDLVVRQVGGGPLMLYENRFKPRHYLRVSLRGHQSNRLGIGARLIATVGQQRLFRDLLPVNSFRSQAPAIVHFGLGDAEKIDRLEIRWPSGKVQIFTDLAADRHVVLDEDSQQAETVQPGRTIRP